MASTSALRLLSVLVLSLAACGDPTTPILKTLVDGPGAIQAANVAPDAIFAVSPRYPAPGDTVTFDASWAFDRDGRVVSYTWDLGNGVTQVSGPVARTVYRGTGTYSVQLTVHDDSGATTGRALSLDVSSAGAPANAVSATQSAFVLGNVSVGAATAVPATVVVRNGAGQPLAGVNVQVGGQGRALSITQPPVPSDAIGVATANVATSAAQAATLRAVADFTLLDASPGLTVTPGTLSLTGSTMRITDPVLGSGLDSTLVEITARDAYGNGIAGANVSLLVTGGPSTVRNLGTTDADGRRIATVLPAVCGGTVLTVTAVIGGTSLPETGSLTNSNPSAYGVCGATLWLDAQDASSVVLTNGRVSSWRDKSGASADAAVTSGDVGPLYPTSGTTLINGRRAIAFDSTLALSSLTALPRVRPDISVYVVGASATPTWNTWGWLASARGPDGFIVHPEQSGRNTSTFVIDSLSTYYGASSVQPTDITVGHLYGLSYAQGANTLGALLDGGLSAGSPSSGARARRSAAVAVTLGRDFGAGGRYARGSIGEVLVFDHALTTGERLLLEAALMTRWGIGSIAISAGNAQSATLGTLLPTAPQVRVTNGTGAGIAGATVTWQVVSGNGSVSQTTTTTDATGYATVNWTLGALAGAQSLVAWYGTSAGIGQSVTFTATASGVCAYGICDATLWLDASDAASVQLSSGSVSQWSDRSGYARHAVQSTSANRPSFTSTGFNGRPTLLFNGTSQSLLSTLPTNPSARSVLAILSPGSTTNTRSILSSSVNAGFQYVLSAGQPALCSFSIGCGTQSLTAVSVGTPTVVAMSTPGTALLTLYRQNGASAGLNGTTNLTFSGSGQSTIGVSGPASHFYNGAIAELVVFDRTLTTTELDNAQRQLMAKWGIGTMSIDAGDGQTGAPGAALPVAPRIRIVDASGTGIANATVSWQVTGGAGTVSSSSTTTDANGYAGTTWTLGPAGGTHSLTAWYGASAGSGSALSFTATAGACAYGVCGSTLWLDASVAGSFTVESGNRVTTWRDQSGWSNHATAGSGSGARPTYGAAAYLSRPGVVFAGGSNATSTPQFLTLAQYPLQGRSAGTGLVVFLRSAQNSCERLFDFGSNTTVHLMLAPNCGSHRATITISGIPGEVTASASTNGTALNTPYLTSVVHGSTIAIRVDGTQRGSVTASLAPSAIGTPSNNWLGRSQFSADGYLSGTIAEVLFFPRALNSSELLAVEQALLVKWGGGNFAVTSGNSQSAAAGTSPSVAPRVRLTDASGAGLSGATVTWQVTSGGARFGASALTHTTTTDASGYASAPVSGNNAWTLDVGTNQLTAWLSSTAGQGQSAVFTASGTLPTGVASRLDASLAGAVRTASSCASGTATDGQLVGCLFDASGNSAHAVQALSAAQPTSIANGMNGRPALGFTLTRESWMAVTATSVRNMRGTSRTVLVAARANATEDNNTNAWSSLAVWTGWNSGVYLVGYPLATDVASAHWTHAVTGAQIVYSSITGVQPNTPFVATSVIAIPTATTFQTTAYLNGVAGPTGNVTDNAPLAGANDLRIGQAAVGPDTQYRWRLDGRIGEVVVFSRALSNSERLQVERYLGWKWGVTIP